MDTFIKCSLVLHLCIRFRQNCQHQPKGLFSPQHTTADFSVLFAVPNFATLLHKVFTKFNGLGFRQFCPISSKPVVLDACGVLAAASSPYVQASLKPQQAFQIPTVRFIASIVTVLCSACFFWSKYALGKCCFGHC